MNKKPAKKISSSGFEKVSARITKASGSMGAVLSAMIVIIAWLITGPVFHFSDTWQLVINTGTTIITFIMVFVIQHSQNKDTTAIQLKLNELIAASSHASNRLVNVEELSEEELLVLKKFYQKLALLSRNEHDLFSTHSIDEAQYNHQLKKENFDTKK